MGWWKVGKKNKHILSENKILTISFLGASYEDR